MRDWFHLLLCIIRNKLRSSAEIEAENLALRHQLNVSLRMKPKVHLRSTDRLFLVLLYRLFPSVLSSIAIVQPATLVRWHRTGFRLFWRWKLRGRGGRPKIDRKLRSLIQRMYRENPLWGAPRLHGELLKLGYEVSQATISRYIRSCSGHRGQTWKTFLANHADGIASVDFLVVPTITFDRLFAFVVLGHARRQLVHIGVTRQPTAEWLSRQMIEALSWDTAPDILIRDNDSSHGIKFKRRLAGMGIRDQPTSLRSPWQNGHVERVIGTIRRECLDHVIVRDESHLRRVLSLFQSYYNDDRTHLALSKEAPRRRPIQRTGRLTSASVLGGLHHRYARTR